MKTILNMNMKDQIQEACQSITYRRLEDAEGKDSGAVEQVAKILYDWWGEECGMTLDDMVCLCARDVGTHPTALSSVIPRTRVALDGDQVVGCVKLVTNDTTFRQDLYPVLSSVYVLEDHRGRGIASNLVDHVLQYAFRQGDFAAVHLGTGLTGFYEQFGFRFMDEDYVFFETAHGIHKDREKDRIYRITRSEWEDTK